MPGRQTFAISSLFLNSPLTSVTFPFISNSVHRNRNSFVAFDTNPRPMLKFDSVPSSISAGPVRLALDLASDSLLRLRSKSLRSSGRLLVDAVREGKGLRGESDSWTGSSLPSAHRPRGGVFFLVERFGMAKRFASTVALHGAGSRPVQFDILRSDRAPDGRPLEHVVERRHVDGLAVK